jgi:serine/threonine protein kinase/WD40 repeat protein/tetratricopeptide (TPR) repeat protein
MNETSSGPDLLNDLAHEFTDRYRRGERPALTEYTEKYPELAAEIRELFPALAMMEQFASPVSSQTGPHAKSITADGTVPRQLGEYRVLREVARGGMGIVYEAVQESLGRHVALKVLPFQSLARGHDLERFQREARAAANLHHTNIVPVFGVGVHEGIHYYAMQFIQGQSLDSVLTELRRLRRSQANAKVPVEEAACAAQEDRRADLSVSLAGGLLSGRLGTPSALVAKGLGAPSPLGGEDPRGTDWQAVLQPSPRAGEDFRGTDCQSVLQPSPPPVAKGPEAPSPLGGEGRGGGRKSAAGTSSSELAVGALSGILDSRAEVMSQTETEYFRSVVRIGVQVAEALAYAHGQGVLHRDIKPSNLLLDTQGTVWVTDFGLAKAADSDDLTHTGDIVGTLRYMAPERFHGQADARSDVYGLGVTLYELVTFQPAFQDLDRARLIQRVVQEEPARPRKLNPAITRDLETLILKAIAKEPEQRYASAAAMAEDLRRFLADRPIRARRSSAWERTRRWCRRNPAVASLTGAVAGLILTVAVVSTLSALSAQKQLRLTQQAQEEGTRRLYHSLVAQARASRLSRRVGQRFDSLKALEEAAKIARQLNLPEEDFLELRNQAIACLALPDLRVAKEWDGWPADTTFVLFDQKLERYARHDQQGNISIRRVADDGEICHLEAADWPRFSLDGRFLAALGPGSVKLWQLGGAKHKLIREEPAAMWHAFSPDSRLFAVGHADGSIGLFELPSGKPLRRLSAGTPPRVLAFNPKGGQLALASETSVQVRDLKSGRIDTEFHYPANDFPWVAWHPDGRTVAAVGGDRIIHFWDVATGKETLRLEGCKNDGIYFAFNHRGDRVVSQSWESMLRLWDARTGQELFRTPSDWGLYPCFSPEDRLLAGDLDRAGHKLRLWEVTSGREYRTLVRDPVFGKGPYCGASIHPDGRLLAASMDNGFGLWDLATGAHLAVVSGYDKPPVLFEPSGALLSNRPDGLWRWPVQRVGRISNPSHSLRLGPPERVPLPGSPHGIAASADGRVLASAQGGGALVLHADQLERPVRLGPHEDTRYVAVSPNGRWVATGTHTGIAARIWDAQTGKLVNKLLPAEPSTAIAFSPDGQWFITNYPTCRLWAVDGWKERLGVAGVGLAFSPDGKLLAVGTAQGTVRLVDPETGKEYARLEDPNQDRAGTITFSPDGTLLVTTSNNDSQAIHVWDLRAIREQLAEMRLDWNLPPYLPARPSEQTQPAAGVKPLEVQVDQGCLIAREKYSLVLAFFPFHAEAYYQRGLAYKEFGQWPEALADFNMAISLKPDHAEAHALHSCLLGTALQKKDKLDEAAAVFQEALHKLPKPPGDEPIKRLLASLYKDLAFVRAQKGQWKKAAAESAKAIQLGADAADLDTNGWQLAWLRMHLGTQAEHRLTCLRLLERYQQTGNLAATRLCVLHPDRVIEPRRALQLAIRGVELNPDRAWFWETLGLAHYRAGDWKAAVAACQKAMPLRAQSGSLEEWRFVLAMAQWQLGDQEQARRSYDQGLDWLGKNEARLDQLRLRQLHVFRDEAAALLGIKGQPAVEAKPE